jgi:hypothetical protein
MKFGAEELFVMVIDVVLRGHGHGVNQLGLYIVNILSGHLT